MIMINENENLKKHLDLNKKIMSDMRYKYYEKLLKEMFIEFGRLNYGEISKISKIITPLNFFDHFIGDILRHFENVSEVITDTKYNHLEQVHKLYASYCEDDEWGVYRLIDLPENKSLEVFEKDIKTAVCSLHEKYRGLITKSHIFEKDDNGIHVGFFIYDYEDVCSFENENVFTIALEKISEEVVQKMLDEFKELSIEENILSVLVGGSIDDYLPSDLESIFYNYISLLEDFIKLVEDFDDMVESLRVL